MTILYCWSTDNCMSWIRLEHFITSKSFTNVDLECYTETLIYALLMLVCWKSFMMTNPVQSRKIKWQYFWRLLPDCLDTGKFDPCKPSLLSSQFADQNPLLRFFHMIMIIVLSLSDDRKYGECKQVNAR